MDVCYRFFFSFFLGAEAAFFAFINQRTRHRFENNKEVFEGWVKSKKGNISPLQQNKIDKFETRERGIVRDIEIIRNITIIIMFGCFSSVLVFFSTSLFYTYYHESIIKLIFWFLKNFKSWIYSVLTIYYVSKLYYSWKLRERANNLSNDYDQVTAFLQPPTDSFTQV